MIRVPLNQGRFALVDEEDTERVLSRAWFCTPADQIGDRFYAIRQENRRTVYMHRFILSAPPHLTVDHINGDGLDNRRCNLRLATRSQNNANRSHSRVSGSGFRGVYLNKGRYAARIWVNNKGIYLGRFDTPEAAARAYDEAALKHFGRFGRLNFPGRRVA